MKTTMEAPVFLGLGSNLGDREATLEAALQQLDERGFETVRRSANYATEPVGGPPQGFFLNAVVAGRTALTAPALLEVCLAIERGLGRVRDVRNGPRTIDIDVLFYGRERLALAGLVVPHPRLHERRFVLAPLAEIAPDLVHPVLRRTAAELLARCPDRSLVERLGARPAEGR